MFELNIEQKKGNANALDGRLTVYAVVDLDPSEISGVQHPVSSMVHNGLLVAQGNFKEQRNIRDFLKSEMGVSFEEGLEELLEKAEGLESVLDPDKLKEKLDAHGAMEEFIPTPAKIVAFHSEEEILQEAGDVFFCGHFKNVSNAVLSVNSLPILYQARFREQEMDMIRNEIDTIISQIETTSKENQELIQEDNELVEKKLLKEFIPNMLYCRKDKKAFTTAETQFKTFMSGYRYQEDIDLIISIISQEKDLTAEQYKKLELLPKKISAILREDFETANQIQSEIIAMDH